MSRQHVLELHRRLRRTLVGVLNKILPKSSGTNKLLQTQ